MPYGFNDNMSKFPLDDLPSGGGGAVFYIDSEYDDVNDVITLLASYDDIMQAIDDGKLVYAKIDTIVNNLPAYIVTQLSLFAYVSDFDAYVVTFLPINQYSDNEFEFFATASNENMTTAEPILGGGGDDNT